MSKANYLTLIRNRDIRNALLLGLLIRVPMCAASVVLTLHIVSHLHRSYASAGLLVGVSMIAVSIAGPWRGRRLDRVGLRRSTTPSLITLTVCWSVAPWLSYWPLMAMVFVAGLFLVPTFSIIRQVLISRVGLQDRKTVLVLDAVFMEVSFMVGPILGVLLAQRLGTPVTLLICELTSVAGAALLWWLNPALKRESDASAPVLKHKVRDWMTPRVLAILTAAGSAVVVLSGTDLSIVAALRSLSVPHLIGAMLAIWGGGSAMGGLAYGAMKRHPPLMLLLGLLGLTTAATALAPGLISFAVLLFVCGAFCAPTMTAATDALTRAVPSAIHGEALGWSASFNTAATSLGAPLAGLAIDFGGWQAGFAASGALGVAVAIAGYLLAPNAGADGQDQPLNATTR